jgi:cellulose synthase/poly-beta-1,6-N-acetylglucosamine synthase-like glycosyltransferase
MCEPAEKHHKCPAHVDLIIPVFNEHPEALDATLLACMQQTYPIEKIFVVDDGSLDPVLLPAWARNSPRIVLIRLTKNCGISAARNAGIGLSKAIFLGCVDTEVIPDSDWLATCTDYLANHPRVGACFTRIVPKLPNSLLTRWRMRFLETDFGECSKIVEFGNHAVLFRREALDAVRGYNERYRFHHEDSDICKRMLAIGWETHFVAMSRCVSIQSDTLADIAVKQLRDSNWYSPEDSLLHLYKHLSWWTFNRIGRNLIKGRLHFLPADLAIWSTALWIATTRTLRSWRKHSD